MKIVAFVFASMVLLAPLPGVAQTSSKNIKMAAACSLKGYKNCYDWCQKNGRMGRDLERCTITCQGRHPDCR